MQENFYNNFMDLPTSIPKSSNKNTKNAPIEESGGINWYQGVVNGVLIVVGLGFITLLMTYFQQSAVSYEGLKDQVLLQNQKIDYLTEQLNNKPIVKK